MECGKHRRLTGGRTYDSTIQLRRDCCDQNKTSQQTARTFAKLMMEGKVRAALLLISKSSSNDVLHLDSYSDPDNPTETVRETLLKKHPNQQPYKQSSIVTPTTPTNEPHPIFFDMIDGHLIRSTALRMGALLVPKDWTLLHGNACVHHSSQHLRIYVKLLQSQPDVCAPALSSPAVCLRLLLATLLL